MAPTLAQQLIALGLDPALARILNDYIGAGGGGGGGGGGTGSAIDSGAPDTVYVSNIDLGDPS